MSHVPADSPAGADDRRGLLKIGDKVQLTDSKGRMNTIILKPGAEFHTHKGIIAHDDIIGAPDGITVANSAGAEYQVLKPLYSDFVLSMPRGAAIIYPKDAALITGFGDIFPGARVVEAGVGSGALTIALLRAVGDTGSVHSFELRDEFAKIAAGNIEDFFAGEHPAWNITVGDLSEELPKAYGPGEVDRVVLDMLAPWECLDAVTEALVPGGVLVVYVATVPQLSRTVQAMDESGSYTKPHALESTVRDWHLDGLAVRPEHRMIGHTGFLVFARKVAQGYEPLRRTKRGQQSPPDKRDYDAWFGPEVNDETMRVKHTTPKKVRRSVREAGTRLDVMRSHEGENNG